MPRQARSIVSWSASSASCRAEDAVAVPVQWLPVRRGQSDEGVRVAGLSGGEHGAL
jgi:hypothetical protein